MKTELIYFEGCPNAAFARENLRKALDAGDGAEWTEWEQSDENAPDYVRQYGSPTILVDGKDIAGGPSDCCAAHSCRLYEGGVPSVDMIRKALGT
ncbi:MAG: hypothetical protein GC185_06665 [Alphaproteobacteria bacterium]|nr:hypothetical protein [Alphaproteobacteria bacterium]